MERISGGEPVSAPITFRYRWFWKASPMRPIDRRGEACRILVRAPAFNSILVEFLDGFKVVCSRHAVRVNLEKSDL